MIIGKLLAAAILAVSAVAGARAAQPPTIAVLDFQMINSTILPETAGDQARLEALGRELRAALEKSGRYRVINIAPIRPMLAKEPLIPYCNGCEIGLARKLGADLVAVDYVQKVSALILNINVLIENAHTGKLIGGGSVDIRGDNDEAWHRGLDYLLAEHLHIDG